MDRVVACRIVDRVAFIALLIVLMTACIALVDRNVEYELAKAGVRKAEMKECGK